MEKETRVYGYIRVSTKEQHLDRQRDALLKDGVPSYNIREDKLSGADFDRFSYQSLKNELRSGDTLVIKELDRLGRDYEGIKNEWNDLTKKGVSIKVLDMPILNTCNRKDGMEGLIQNIVFEILSYIAENERNIRAKRQREGIEQAKLQGKHLGRPIISKPKNFSIEIEKWRNGEITAVECWQNLNLTKSTFYRMVKK